MNNVWLWKLEQEISNKVKVRPLSSCDNRSTSHSLGKPSESISSKDCSDIPVAQSRKQQLLEEKRNRKEANEANFLAWKSSKDNQIKSQKFLQLRKRSEIEEELILNKEKHAEKIDEEFRKWKLAKSKKQKEKDLQDLKFMEEQKKLIAELKIKRQLALGMKKPRTNFLENKSPKVTTHPHEKLNSRYDKLEHFKILEDDFPWVSKRKFKPKTTEIVMNNDNRKHQLLNQARREARLRHQSEAYRADSLRQLREWSRATPEIYLLASILHKIVIIEIEEHITLVDPWRWLPWKIVRSVFQDNLVEKLKHVKIAELKPLTLCLLYLHCSIGHFKLTAVKKRSEVATALRHWINNIASVHNLVELATFRHKPIDCLKAIKVPYSYIAIVFLYLEVYSKINFKKEDFLTLKSNTDSTPNVGAKGGFRKDVVIMYTFKPPGSGEETDENNENDTVVKVNADKKPATDRMEGVIEEDNEEYSDDEEECMVNDKEKDEKFGTEYKSLEFLEIVSSEETQYQPRTKRDYKWLKIYQKEVVISSRRNIVVSFYHYKGLFLIETYDPTVNFCRAHPKIVFEKKKLFYPEDLCSKKQFRAAVRNFGSLISQNLSFIFIDGKPKFLQCNIGLIKHARELATNRNYQKEL